MQVACGWAGCELAGCSHDQAFVGCKQAFLRSELCSNRPTSLDLGRSCLHSSNFFSNFFSKARHTLQKAFNQRPKQVHVACARRNASHLRCYPSRERAYWANSVLQLRHWGSACHIRARMRRCTLRQAQD